MSDTVDDRDPPPIAPHPNQRRSACERCRRQKLKCSRQNAANQSRCQRCARLGFECVGGRQRKVGRPSRSDVAAAAAAAAAATAPSATVLILNAAKSSKKGPPSSSSTRVWKNASTHVSDSGFKSTSTSNAPSSNNSTPEPRTVKLAARPARSVKVSEPSAMNGPARSSGVPFTIAEQPRIGSDSFNAALANVDNLFQSFNEQDNRFPKTCAHQLPGNVAPLLDMSHADNQQSTADVSNDFNLAAEALALHESIDIAWPLDTNAYQNAQAFQPQPQQQQQQLDEDHQTHHTYYQHQYTQQRNQSLSKAQPRTRGPNSRPQSSFFPFPTPFYQYPSFNNRNSRDYPLEPLVAGPTAMVPVPKSTSPKSNSFLDVLDNLSAINTSFQRCVYLIKKHGEALNVAILIANKPPFAMNGISVMNRGVFNLKELLRLLISLQNSLSSSTEDSQSGDPQPQSARMKLPVPHPSCIKMPFPSPVLDGIQRVVQEASSSSSETATNTPKVLDTPTSLAMISCYSQGLFFLETTVAHINRALADPDARPLYNLANERYGGVPFHEHLMRGVVFAQLLMNVIERLDDLMGIPPKDPSIFPLNSSRGLLNECQMKMLWLELRS
ncbi:Fusaric acid cluster transcription factor FUB10 [Ceratocystis fimbriata CBS 114723]|uniref:Fusaric acid cluster transcription factor FUB10 n=1 Tax=Ceratocystis fimbriata CBS 114723 TaxID=1035309 RepID=A0A2C5X482_9PEZI|nr:Fusaric acid cluster transcription factor FUB10 [Ceratocystis fimbriata CBS 114723]